MGAQKVSVMPDKPSSNVKVYDRPERQGPSPLLLVIGLVIVLLVAFFLYKTFYHPAPAPVKAPPGLISLALAVEQGKELR